MHPFPPMVYDEWRRGHLLAPGRLHEGIPAGFPPERLLQAVWHHQRLLADQLRTPDGRGVRILHPGFPNRSAGPDFHRAIIQLENAAPQTGDIEIDLLASNWRTHRHHVNPAYAQVILHVVWEAGSAAAAGMPVLPLKGCLDAPLEELQLWLGSEAAQEWPPEAAGRCRQTWRNLPEVAARGLLRQAAQVRLEAKARQMEARSRQTGWDQALWEGLFRGLGYRQNAWPMQRLAATLKPCFENPGQPADGLVWQARLLGLSGLLPGELPGARDHAPGKTYLRTLWDCWWRERSHWGEAILPKGMWNFQGLRPANHPTRRLALAAWWLGQCGLIQKLEDWFTRRLASQELADSLAEILQPAEDAFWGWHWTLRSVRLPQPQPLLGSSRNTDLAINVILPWFWIRAKTGRNQSLLKVAEERFLAWPKGDDNAVLRLARQRMFAAQFPIRTAAEQQGLLQIVRDFCDHANARCDQCPWPTAGGEA